MRDRAKDLAIRNSLIGTFVAHPPQLFPRGKQPFNSLINQTEVLAGNLFRPIAGGTWRTALQRQQRSYAGQVKAEGAGVSHKP